MQQAWLWWLVAALVLATCEVLGAEFVFLMLAGAALAGAVTNLLGGGLPLQVIVVAVVAVVLLLLVRPWLRRRVMAGVVTPPMGAETYVGQLGTVTEQVWRDGGLVRLPEGTWTARPAVAGETFLPGQSVRVVGIDGATALVTGVPVGTEN